MRFIEEIKEYERIIFIWKEFSIILLYLLVLDFYIFYCFECYKIYGKKFIGMGILYSCNRLVV